MTNPDTPIREIHMAHGSLWLTLEEWLGILDRAVERHCGVSIECLPDWDYASAWEAGDSPYAVAREVVAEMAADYGIETWEAP